ncbi:MAG TPA: AraC family transcriptional regulator [Candidatus Paenibacillus intestinavium]|nr:AraC family transcriptional regulator [Candidatus Paenibacillus intestinavium]
MEQSSHELLKPNQHYADEESTKESYRVASNPIMTEPNQQWLHVLFAGESYTKPMHRLGPKVYDFYLMHVILSGSGSFITEHQHYQLHAGDTFLIRPNELISYVSDSNDPWHYRWVAFRGEQAEHLVATAGFTSGCEVINIASLEPTGSYYHDILEAFRYSHPTSSIYASGLLHMIMTEYGRAQQPSDHGLHRQQINEHQLHNQIVHYLTTQYTHPVSIEHMAEALGYNRAYLSRIFKQKIGVTPSTFLLQLRLDNAKRLLRERHELTIEQVSASVGIQDALYFSKQFKKRYQQSPTSYRKRVLDQMK